MKKTLIAALLGSLAIAYPASSWYIGKQLEATLDEQIRQLQKYPYEMVVDRKFKRGIFSSEERVTLRIPSTAYSLTSAEITGGEEKNPPLELSFKTLYRHGPFPDFSHPAIASFVSEFIPSPEQQIWVQKLFGNAKPLELSGEYGFEGWSKTRLSSPGFAFDNLEAGEGQSIKLRWQGMRMEIDTRDDMQQKRYTLDFPGLEIASGNDQVFKLSSLRVESDTQRILDDFPLLEAGTTRLSLDALQLAYSEENEDGDVTALKLNTRKLLQETKVSNGKDFLDISTRTSLQELQIADNKFGPMNLDFSLRHLQSRSLASLQSTLAKMNADQSSTPQTQLASIRPQFEALLRGKPEFHLDNLSLHSPAGEVKAKAKLGLGALDGKVFENPLAQLGQLTFEGNFSLPQALLKDAWPPDAIEALVAQNYVQKDAEILNINLKFSGGQLTLNNQPFSPAMLQRGQQPM